MSETDRARFLYSSIMRQTSESDQGEVDRVYGFHGKEPETVIKHEVHNGRVVGVRYERLELIKFDQRMSDEDINEWYKENDPLSKWCDGDGLYDPGEGVGE